MIFGSLDTWDADKKFFPSSFASVLSFWDKNTLSILRTGRHTIDGDTLYAEVADVVTEPPALRRFELHRQYIDIHLVLSGKELQLYAQKPKSQEGLLEDLLVEKDVAFYSHPLQYHRIILEQGDYVAYLPGELHCPCCRAAEEAEARKIIFKIHKDA